MKTRQMILCALFAALTAAGIFVRIPIPGTPILFTLQTFFVFLAGLLLEPKYAFLSQVVYLAVGLLGIPVFTKGGGISYVLEPSFGFLLGFCVCAFLISVFVRREVIEYISLPQKSSLIKIAAYALLSMVGLYVLGIIYMYLILNTYMGKGVSLEYMVITANGIFFLLDMLKFAVAIPVGIAVLKRVPAIRTVRSKA